MKKIFLFYLAIIITTIANAQSAKFIAADSAYNSDDYTGAIRLYEDVIATEGTSSAIFYNLGNAGFRFSQSQSVDQQVLGFKESLQNYENALAINKEAKDTKHNIEVVKRYLKRAEKQQQQEQKQISRICKTHFLPSVFSDSFSVSLGVVSLTKR